MARVKTVLVAALVGAILGFVLMRVDLSAVKSVPFLETDRALTGHRVFLIICVALWAIFGLYWEAAAKNVAAAQSSESRSSRGVHVFLANAALLLEIAPIRGLGRFLPAWPSIMVAGIAVEAAGLFLAIWSRRHLGRYWSGEITIKVDHELIRSGPYGLVRHPIYTGLLIMYFGVAVVTGEWLAVIGVALAVFAYWRKISLEEANLRLAFGEEYDSYCQSTWALLPGVL